MECLGNLVMLMRQLKSFYSKHCTSFYGAELWAYRKGSSNEFKAISKAYHNAIKVVLGFPLWFIFIPVVK